MPNDDEGNNVVQIHASPENKLRGACLRMARFMSMITEGQEVPRPVIENEAKMLREAYGELVETWAEGPKGAA